jgi:Transglycosylase SLT domain
MSSTETHTPRKRPPDRRPTATPTQLPRRLMRALLACTTLGALLVAALPVASAWGGVSGETVSSQAAPPANTTSTATSTSTSSQPPAEAPAGTPSGEAPTATVPSTTTSTPPPGGAVTTTAPQVQTQSPQTESSAGASVQPGGGSSRPHKPPSKAGTEQKAGATVKKGGSTGVPGARKSAPAPSALTPPLPGALGSATGGVPDFFIESFGIPPFLLPIYQAAGAAYGIPWEVLAAINEVETDYGRDLSVSSAGAEGWMQFLPSSWARYGVDVNGDGYEDPYNPADAIFAAARYLAAADGVANIRAAVFSYNHSQAYVDAVMLRAQLLDGTPPDLLDALTGLTESRFPVHAVAHFTDGFPTLPGSAPGQTQTVPGTTIYAPAGAPVIAVQDGRIVAIGDSPTLGRYVSLRDAYGNTYTYAQLGSVAELYPVLEPRRQAALAPQRDSGSAVGPGPSEPASAGVQPHSPLSQAGLTSSLALGAAATLETPPAPATPAPPPILPASRLAPVTPRVFRAGPDEVYLHALRPGVEVLAGTVLGHLGESGDGAEPGAASASGSAAAQPEAHMLFQIRPAGLGAPLIDPKPLLDGWVQLENTSIFRAKGQNAFLTSSPSAGQVLLESKPQLEQQVLRDPGVRFAASCGRGEVRAGQVDRRVLAALAFLAAAGLQPTASIPGCGRAGVGSANSAGEALDISAINSIPIAGHEGPGSLADIAVRRLLRLQGTMKPRQIVTGSLSYTGTAGVLTLPADRGLIHLSFATPGGGARAASVQSSPLTPQQWLGLVARLGEIPDPTVANKPSSAAIPDSPSSGEASATSSGAGEE